MKSESYITQVSNGKFWDECYLESRTGWDAGEITTPMKEYIDQIEDKDLAVLIPGCGNSYEAEYMLEKGFRNITILDISEVLANNLREKFSQQNELTITCSDFFKHNGKYDLILEQTFFCALSPEMRKDYAEKVYELLKDEGKLAGVLFSREFEREGPPFGGSKSEYTNLFSDKFEFRTFEECYNSIEPRKGSEIFINLKKKLK